MNIGLITGEFPPDQGGVGDFTDRLAHALTDLGHGVHVITSSSEASDLEPATSGPASQTSKLTVHRAIEHWRFGCWREILRLSRRHDLDALNIQYQAAAYDMHPTINLVPRRQRRPPVVVTFHDLKVPYLFPKAGPLRRWVVHLLARRADSVIVTNREDELRLSALKPRIANLTRIPIGSNIPSALPPGYDRAAERARWGIAPDDVLIGYFGFLNQSKGGEELIETLGLLVEQGLPAHLLKIGGRVGTSDPTNRAYADSVDCLIADRGLQERVHWTGYLPPRRVSASLCATDVCVLPYRDGVSFRRGSLLACLAHGRAVITTHPAVPLPEVRDGESMLLVEPESATALAQAVIQLAGSPTLQARLEAGAEELATHFRWDTIAQRTAALLADLRAGDP
jgi:glycosyltransferase involved in cell wall biosynthesis